MGKNIWGAKGSSPPCPFSKVQRWASLHKQPSTEALPFYHAHCCCFKVPVFVHMAHKGFASCSYVLVPYVSFYVRSHIKKWNPLGHFCTPLGALLRKFRNQIAAWVKHHRMHHIDCEDWECEGEWQIQTPRCSEEKWMLRPRQKGSECLWSLLKATEDKGHLLSIHSLIVWLMVKTDWEKWICCLSNKL